MDCKVDGCDRKATYKKDVLCQRHYFRFWRYGTYELTRKAKYRTSNLAGYQFLYEPDHPLSYKGKVAEHRFVLFNKFGYSLTECSECKRPWDWHGGKGSHVDHVDEDITNNHAINLRPLCNSCNTRRGRKPEHEYDHVLSIEYNGQTMTAEEWSREDIVPVKGYVIRGRIKAGWDVERALTKPSQKDV